MAIPLVYNLRNLVVRKTTTLMTALGIALTVSVLVAVLALVNGLRAAFQSTANPLNVLVMRKGSTSELSGGMSRSVFDDLKSEAGISRAADGHPLASLELVTVINLPNVDNPDGVNVTLRGITPVGLEVREHVKIAEGRWFRPGMREVVVGRSVAKRYPTAQLGKKLRFGRGEWEVVGVMDAGQTANSSEIFCDLNQMSGDFNRYDGLSSALVRARDRVSVDALVNRINDDRRLVAVAQTEKAYMDSQTSSSAPIQYLGIAVSIIMAIGSSFAAMNTMYAAVARRSADIGMLRMLGFSRAGILASFLVESLILSAAGGVLGCLLVLPLNNAHTRIGSFITFSEITFSLRMTPQVMALGIGFGILMGLLGGFFPARAAAKKEILAAFRAA